MTNETDNTSITPFGEGFSDSVYEFLTKLVQLGLPAVATLYFGLSEIWGLPAADKVVGSLTLLATFFGVLLQISKSNYKSSGAAYDGEMVVMRRSEGGSTFSLEVDGDPQELADKDAVAFKVVPDPDIEFPGLH
jgi:Putative phage holin Dp-1